MLADTLGYAYYYMGAIRRQLAKDKGMSIEELNALGERESWTDNEIDEYLKNIGATQDDFVVDSRTAFHFIPHSIKIFVDVNDRVGAKRVLQDILKNRSARNEGIHLTNVDDVMRNNKERMLSDDRRYQKYYNVSYLDTTQYDLSIDTSHRTPENALHVILEFIKKQAK